MILAMKVISATQILSGTCSSHLTVVWSERIASSLGAKHCLGVGDGLGYSMSQVEGRSRNHTGAGLHERISNIWRIFAGLDEVSHGRMANRSALTKQRNIVHNSNARNDSPMFVQHVKYFAS